MAVMHIAVKAGEIEKKAFLSKGIPPTITIQWLGEDDLLAGARADVYFDLLFNSEFIAADEFITGKQVFVNGVTCTAADLQHDNYIRLNAWAGFLERPVTELAAANDNAKAAAENIFNTLGWQYTWVADVPGMVAARVVSMIINEAFFAVADGVSSREEIDIAMKLGTNYPYGPFEWGRKIGLANIYFLLKKLQRQYGNRYAAAPLLEQEATHHGVIA